MGVMHLLLLAALLRQPAALDEAKAAAEKTGAASYAFKVAGRFERSGEWFPSQLLVSRIDKFQSARHQETMLVKGPEGLWKTPQERIGEATENQQKDVADMMKTLEEARAPHRMALELLAEASKVSRGDDVDVEGTIPCRVFYLSFREERARKELDEQIEKAGKRGTLDKPDKILWSSVRSGAQIYVRKSDGLVARVAEHASVKLSYQKDPEQRPDEKKYELKLTLNLSEHGAAKLDLPVELKERLGIKKD